MFLWLDFSPAMLMAFNKVLGAKHMRDLSLETFSAVKMIARLIKALLRYQELIYSRYIFMDSLIKYIFFKKIIIIDMDERSRFFFILILLIRMI